ncbi:MAG: sensor histidine kinase [Anaerolineae bacterium]|jgi:signal transduction histidine kinase|nr:sensor histidine kinase [Chloroflexota bacterium]
MDTTGSQREALRIYRLVLAAEIMVGVLGLLFQAVGDGGRERWYWLFLAPRLVLALVATLPWFSLRLGRYHLAVLLAVQIVLGGVDTALAPVVFGGPWQGPHSGIARLEPCLQVPPQAYLLLVPATLAGWGYGRLGALVGGLLATLFVLLGVYVAVDAGVAVPQYLLSVAVLVLMFSVLPTIVSVLAESERRQREALQSAYQRLRRHAATVEQLAISRERNRLARALHDTLAHSLAAIAVQLEAVRAQLAHDPGAAEATVLELGGLARAGLAEARHAIQALRVDPVASMGLEGALRDMATDFEARTGLRVAFRTVGGQPDLTAEEARMLYRISEEALLNVERHARAGHVQIELEQSSERVSVSVRDDGVGFLPEQVGPDHFGIVGMHERASLMGAELTLRSQPGAGTQVTCVLMR